MSGLSVDLDSSTNSVPYLQRTARAANSNRYESEETTGVKNNIIHHELNALRKKFIVCI